MIWLDFFNWELRVYKMASISSRQYFNIIFQCISVILFIIITTTGTEGMLKYYIDRHQIILKLEKIFEWNKNCKFLFLLIKKNNKKDSLWLSQNRFIYQWNWLPHQLLFLIIRLFTKNDFNCRFMLQVYTTSTNRDINFY